MPAASSNPPPPPPPPPPANNGGEVVVVEKKKRSKNPGRRVSGGRVYDPLNGKSCHQCRQKTMDLCATCTNMKKQKQCSINFCHKCMKNRYGEKAEDAVKLSEWKCPKCRGICNCSLCRKKSGYQPTGKILQTAKATGYTCVSELLLAKGVDNVCQQKIAIEDSTSPSSRKPGEESFSEENYRSSFDVENGRPISIKRKYKKRKRVGSEDFGSEDTWKKVKVSQDEDNIVVLEDAGVSNAADIIDLEANIEETTKSPEPLTPELELPLGSSTVTVAGLELLPEDAGNALQLLEFCGAFGEVLGFKRGHAESVLTELMNLRPCTESTDPVCTESTDPVCTESTDPVCTESTDPVCTKSTDAVQHPSLELHIQLLSIIQKDHGEECPSLSQTPGESQWLHALGMCISKSNSKCKAKEFPSDCFSDSGYDKLGFSDKLQLLIFLCDEALCTRAFRNWIDEQSSKVKKTIKEARSKVEAAKRKAKQLKKKLQDEVIKAILARDGSPLSISEHEALLSEMKNEATQAHAEVVEAKSMVPKKTQISEALRTGHVLMDNGHVFWRLNSYPGEFNLLLHDVGDGDATSPSEKWFAYTSEQKEEVEKYISYLRKRQAVSRKLIKKSSLELDEESP